MQHKKAQIGVTLTWIPAFVIVFVIMILFVGASGLLAGKKIVDLKTESITSSVKSVFTLQKTAEVLVGLKEEKNYDFNQVNYFFLNTFLQFEIEKEGYFVKIKDLIFEDLKLNKKIIEVEFSKFINNAVPKPDCYYLKIDGSVIGYFSKEDRDKDLQEKTSSNLALKKGIDLILSSKEKEIELKFYSGSCNE